MPGPVLIGIHATGPLPEAERTLASLRTYSPSVETMLLADGGRAAAFNRLISAGRQRLVVLLEAGCQVGPGWLARLQEALDADPAHGLAGPSTNRAWNEQQAIACRDNPSPFDVAAAAYQAGRRFGRTWQALTPLHSLADFCYAVRRQVIDAIGEADEAYGGGPCWEMDYNVRAARAGFLGVWARGAFVHRPPPGPDQGTRDVRLLGAGRRLYQQRFCALHLRGLRQDFETHCVGDACEHFAPPDLVKLRLRPAAASARRPLVSCVMVTGAGRRRFVERSILYFERQDYPNRELVVLDDGPDDLSDAMPAGARYRRIPAPLSIGAKRNLGCELARGEIIAQWDDDDWYSPERLSRQLEPLLDDRAEVTGLTAEVFFDLRRWEFWTCTAELHRRLFVGDVSGGTLVYWRGVWERLSQYPDTSLAEDADFLFGAMQRGARLERIGGVDRPAYIYLRHGQNTWSFECGKFVDPAGWRRLPEPRLAAEDRAFYADLAHAGAAPTWPEAASC
jgi:hypothetical protein